MAEGIGERRPFRDLLAQPREVTFPKRDRPAPDGALGRVGEAQETLAAVVLEQFNN